MRLRLVTAPWSSLHDLPVDAVVEEQDRHRLLGLDGRIETPSERSYLRLVRDMERAEAAPLGSLLWGGGKPLRLRAIVHDLDAGGPVQAAHLVTVADQLCRDIKELRIKRLGMPLLGSVHGRFPPLAFARIFAPRLHMTRLETFYLVAGSNPGIAVLQELERAFGPADGRTP